MLMKNNDVNGGQLATQAAQLLDRLNASSLDAFCSIRTSLPAEKGSVEADSLAKQPLGGLAIAVKEIIDVAGEVCALGCDAYNQRIPDKSASIVQTLESLGAQVVGITRSTELAIARATTTVNPHASNRTPGASSSGSAAAVGGGLVPFALGSQTIGSTIRPAAYCGIVGFKPSYGIVPLGGVMPLSPTLDHIGFLASSVVQLNGVIPLLDNRFQCESETDNNFRFLFAGKWFQDPVEQVVISGIKKFRVCLEDAGFSCEDWSVDESVSSVEAQVTDTILVKEMADHWHDALYNHDAISCELREFLKRGHCVTQTQYEQALASRAQILQQLRTSLGPTDIIIAPSVCGVAPLREDGTGSRAPQRLWTLAGMPALSLPNSYHQNLPLAIQLIAAPDNDQTLLSAALMAESLIKDHNKP